MANKPVPTKLKALRGNPGKRPLNSHEPPFLRGIPRPPAVLKKNKVAHAEWKRVARQLDGVGMLCQVDLAALAAYCMTFARWLEAEEQIEKAGQVLVLTRGTDRIIKTNPYVHVAHTALRDMIAFLTEFGLTPVARTRLSAPDLQDEEDDFERPVVAGKVGG